MSLTHTTAIRNVLANAVVDAIDAGSGDANGDLLLMTAADAEVATHACSDPAFGAASSGTATADAIADDTSATGGTLAGEFIPCLVSRVLDTGTDAIVLHVVY